MISMVRRERGRRQTHKRINGLGSGRGGCLEGLGEGVWEVGGGGRWWGE